MTPSDLLLQQLLNGLTIGAIYALIALGYTMVYGVIELINFAHGEVFMVGAYLGLLTLLAAGIQGPGPGTGGWLFAVIAMAALGCGLIGLVIERLAYRPLRQAPKLSCLITAIGVSFFLQNAVMLGFGAQDRYVPAVLPVVSLGRGVVTLTPLQGIIFGTTFLFMVGLHWVVNKTSLGRAMRATAQDPLAAQLMGISVTQVIAGTFFLGSALAGVGGVLFGMHYSTINFHDGYLTGLKAFTAAVLGGIGSIPGAMVGGILLGLLEGLGAGYISTQWKNVIAFGVLIAVLLFRPRGLLGERVADRA